jgi:hypothetical protein
MAQQKIGIVDDPDLERQLLGLEELELRMEASTFGRRVPAKTTWQSLWCSQLLNSPILQ